MGQCPRGAAPEHRLSAGAAARHTLFGQRCPAIARPLPGARFARTIVVTEARDAAPGMIEGMMPLRPTAATRRQKRWGAAMAVLLLAAILAALGPARAGDFVDSAGRRVLLPEPIERVMPANPTAEVLVYVLAPARLGGAGRPARRGATARRHVPVLGWRPGMGPAGMAGTADGLRAPGL